MSGPLFWWGCGPRACSFVGGGTLAQVFFVNFAKFFRTAFLTTHLGWLLLARGFIWNSYMWISSPALLVGNQNYTKMLGIVLKHFHNCILSIKLHKITVILTKFHRIILYSTILSFTYFRFLPDEAIAKIKMSKSISRRIPWGCPINSAHCYSLFNSDFIKGFS